MRKGRLEAAVAVGGTRDLTSGPTFWTISMLEFSIALTMTGQ